MRSLGKRRLLISFLISCSIYSLALQHQACAKAPPTLGPQGVIAFQNIQIQKPLDLARDIAIEANATTPPLVREDVTRKIVLWHKSALTVLHTRNGDWKVTLASSMDEVLKNLNPQESSVLKPYFDLVKAILASLS